MFPPRCILIFASFCFENHFIVLAHFRTAFVGQLGRGQANEINFGMLALNFSLFYHPSSPPPYLNSHLHSVQDCMAAENSKRILFQDMEALTVLGNAVVSDLPSPANSHGNFCITF